MVRSRFPKTSRGILAESAEHEERKTGLEDALFDFDFFVGNKTAFDEEVANIRGEQIAALKETGADFIGKALVDIHLRALRINEHAPRGVLQKKRHVETFVEDPLPLMVLARLFPLPGLHAIEVTGSTGDRSGESLRPDGIAGNLDQADGGAVNPGKRSIEDQTLVAQHAEPLKEKERASRSAQ